ncbi:MAG: zinc ABC transporter substrate-binding protein [Saccharospirillum sp.]
MRPAFKTIRALVVTIGILGPVAALASPAVTVSIAPLHSLVANLMQGVSEPELVYEASQSPHSSALSPYQLRTIVNTDVMLWVGPELEVGLSRLIQRLPDEAVTYTLHDYDASMTLYAIRDTLFETLGNSHSHNHDHGDTDPHFWLSVDNARQFARFVEARLVALDPDNARYYRDNARALDARLTALDRELAQQLAPLVDQPFIVLHDGFQYFDRSYGLNALGALVLSPDIPPGPRTVARLAEVGQQQQNRLCLFREPQYSERWMQPLLQAIPGAGAGQIDPLGATLTPGPDLYFDMMQALVDDMRRCFSSIAGAAATPQSGGD